MKVEKPSEWNQRADTKPPTNNRKIEEIQCAYLLLLHRLL